jgi:hypothetical protein
MTDFDTTGKLGTSTLSEKLKGTSRISSSRYPVYNFALKKERQGTIT